METLDLHDNLLSGDFKFNTSGIKELKALKNLNLSGNQIESVELDTSISNPEEANETFKNLVEINFRGNKIKEFKLGPLTAAYGYQLENLQRVFLSNNCLQNLKDVHTYSYKDQGISQDLLLPALQVLTIENNPIASDTNLAQILKEKFPALPPQQQKPIAN